MVLRRRKAGLKGVRGMAEQDLHEVAFAKLDEEQMSALARCGGAELKYEKQAQI